MAGSLHPAAPHHLPGFITAPGEVDGLMIGTAAFLVLTMLTVGVLYWRLHALPEHIAHKSHKLQLEIVGILGLISLFTHMHVFWIAGLLLAMIDIPDFGDPLRRMAGSLERIAGRPSSTPYAHRVRHDEDAPHEAPAVRRPESAVS